jgi:hypothetical protein
VKKDFEILELACPLIIPLEYEFLLKYIHRYGIERNDVKGRLFVELRISEGSALWKKPEELLKYFSEVSFAFPYREASYYLTVFEK